MSFSVQKIQHVAEKFQTPYYLYSEEMIRNRVADLKNAVDNELEIYYAAKANPNFEIIKLYKDIVDGVDVSSGGELEAALAAGYNPEKFSFAGPGKTDHELELAVKNQIGSISIESLNELPRVENIAAQYSLQANVSIRINPINIFKDFAIKMGGKSTQFGIDEENYLEFFEILKECPHCDFIGIHVYSGTQCLNSETLVENFINTIAIVQKVIDETGQKPAVINFGGGFGVPMFEGQNSIELDVVGTQIKQAFVNFKGKNNLAQTIGLLELGRYLVSEAGVYVAKVIDVKESRGEFYCVVDGGMNHHLAASGNFGQVIRKNYQLVNFTPKTSEKIKVQVVGPLCTSIDLLGKNVLLEKPEIGDLIGILYSGAYAYSASPHDFLSHASPIELLEKSDKTIQLIRASRETNHINR